MALAKIAFERIPGLDAANRNFDKIKQLAIDLNTLRSLVIDTGGLSVGVRFGHSSPGVTFTASASTPATTITHGLGKTPAAVFISRDGGAGTGIAWSVDTFTSTTFKVYGSYWASISGSAAFYWLAIG